MRCEQPNTTDLALGRTCVIDSEERQFARLKKRCEDGNLILWSSFPAPYSCNDMTCAKEGPNPERSGCNPYVPLPFEWTEGPHTEFVRDPDFDAG